MKLLPLRHVALIKKHVVHHLSHHRLQWALGLAAVFGFLGWVVHFETCKHFFEFTMAPLAEAFLSKNVE